MDYYELGWSERLIGIKQYSNHMSSIYWEKQGADRLCGVHCVNCLLQGPFFDEVSLAQLAQDLDKLEQSLMLEQGMTSEAVKYMKEESSNVAMDGYYSIQVLQSALKTLNLAMVNIDSLNSGEDLIAKEGFICNSSDHWFSLRKIDKVWYNLNSTNKRLPEIVSDFYLSAFLNAVKDSGYQIFSVEGAYPESSEDRFDYYNKNQIWLDSRRVGKYHQKCIKRKGFKPNISGAGADYEIEKAIAISLGKSYKQYESSGEDEESEEGPSKGQVKQFTGMGASMSEDVVVNYSKFHLRVEDIDMLEFMRQSLEEKFKEDLKEGKLVVLRFPNGKKEQRLFSSNGDVESLYDYVWHRRPNAAGSFCLTNYDSKEKLIDVTIPLFAIEDAEGTIIVMVNDQ